MEIYYGICGEGLGHVGRSCRIIDELIKEKQNVNIFTYGEAYDFLLKINKYNQRLNYISGLNLTHTNNGVSVMSAIKSFIKFAKYINKNVNKTLELISTNNSPDLFITDFEPIMPRVAKILNLPCISIDNQHKLIFDNDLPIGLKIYSSLAKRFIKYYIPTNNNIITTFHKALNTETYIVLRKEIVNQTITNNRSILVYIKNDYFNKIFPILCNIDKQFIVYGPDKQKTPPNIIQKPIDNASFISDLLSCDRIISHAGNQLICEAKYLQKPILAIPIKNQTEQAINAFYLKRDGLGDFCSIDKFSDNIVRDFLQTKYKTFIVKDEVNYIVNKILNGRLV